MFSKFYYKRKLKAYTAALQVRRHFLNQKEVKHLMVAMECEEITQMRAVEKELKPLLSEIPKVSYLIFINTKKDEELSYVSSSQEIILFKDMLVRKHTPNADFVREIEGLNVDVFVNLNREPSMVIDFLTAISSAKMRVGYKTKVDITELQIGVGEKLAYASFFKKLLQFMAKINTEVA